MGCLQVKQPAFGKEGVRPALIVRPPTGFAPTAGTLTQNAAQTHPDPAVDIRKHATLGHMLEIAEPTSQRPIDAGYDIVQAVTVRATSLPTNRGFQLLQALRPRESLPAFEVSLLTRICG